MDRFNGFNFDGQKDGNGRPVLGRAMFDNGDVYEGEFSDFADED